MRGARSAGGTLPSMDIIIVNWNSGEQLRECVASISATGRDGFVLRRVVLVDNASRDGSADFDAPAGLEVVHIRNPDNRGFAAACNQGAAGSSADYLLFLNPDTVLHEASLARPMAFMEDPANASVGICGIALQDENGQTARSCSRFPTTSMFLAKMLGLASILPARVYRQRMTDWDHSSNRDVDQVIGAFFLVRRPMFERLGRFDERFFVYFEEVDLSLRAAAAGFRSHFLSDASAMHHGGGTSRQIKARRLTYNLRSRIEYGIKHFTRASALVLALGTLLVEPISRLALAIVRASPSGCVETVRGFLPLWAAAPNLLRRATGFHS